MRKPTICIGKNKAADQLHSNLEADQCLCFIVQYLYFLNSKFSASSHLLSFYSSVCVEPVRKASWFSHINAADFSNVYNFFLSYILVKKNSKDIWDEEEVAEGAEYESAYDPRPQPE